MNVATRVVSVWKARAIRSYIRRMCSRRSRERSSGSSNCGPVALGVLLGPRDPQLELADAGEVLVHLAAVGLAQALLQLAASSATRSRMLLRNRSRRAFCLAASTLRRTAARRPAADRSPWPSACCRSSRRWWTSRRSYSRSRSCRPGGRAQAQLQRRQPRLRADLLGRHLIDRHAHANVRAGRLHRMRAGEEAGGAAGMVARAVALGAAVVLGQAGEDVDLAPSPRPAARGSATARNRALRPGAPGRHDHAVGDEDERHAHRRRRRPRPEPSARQSVSSQGKAHGAPPRP